MKCAASHYDDLTHTSPQSVRGADRERSHNVATASLARSPLPSLHVQNEVGEAGNLPTLPDFTLASRLNLQWGELSGKDFSHAIDCAYSEMVHWRKNVFSVPSGKAGKQFVRELTTLFSAYAQASALESIS